ncbi:hypothetical protein D3C86_2117540 [compost metagenome]
MPAAASSSSSRSRPSFGKKRAFRLFEIVLRRCVKDARTTSKKCFSSLTSTGGRSLTFNRMTADSTFGWGMNTVCGTVQISSGSL